MKIRIWWLCELYIQKVVWCHISTFRVRTHKKSWKIFSDLSGDEKALSLLALVFAVHYNKPSPLYVMDETDAALGFTNVSIVGHYIKACDWRLRGEGGSWSYSRYFTNSSTKLYFYMILCGCIANIRRLKYIQCWCFCCFPRPCTFSQSVVPRLIRAGLVMYKCFFLLIWLWR